MAEQSLVGFLMPLGLAVLGVACTVLGWLGRTLWEAVQNLKQDIQRLEVKLVTDYVRYDRLTQALEPFKESLARIEGALTGKADKS